MATNRAANRLSPGGELRKARKAAGLTLSALGLKLGVGYQHLSNLELGRATPSLELAVRIQSFAGIAATAWLSEPQRKSA